MSLSRRTFLKLSAGTAAASVFGGLGINLASAEDRAALTKFEDTKKNTYEGRSANKPLPED